MPSVASFETSHGNGQAEDFEEALLERTCECLESGLTPSKKDFVEALVPYWGVLEDAGDPRLARLIEVIRSRAAMESRKAAPRPSPEKRVDAEAESRLSDLRELLRGKTSLFVGGGNKGERGRREAIEKALELKELIWPDCEVATPVGRFEADMLRADLVCKVVKEARTGYGRVIKDAKPKGKLTAYLCKGVGLNVVAYDLNRQLIRK